MNDIKTFDTSLNIWELYPELKTIFSDFYRKDKTLKKIRHSYILWAIFYVYHPNSLLKNYRYKDKEDYVNEGFLKGKSIHFTSSKYKKEVEIFKDGVLSKPQKFLVDWELKLEERQDFINNIKYTLENIDTIDKVFSRTHNLWKQYRDCLKDVEEEKGHTKGGARESAAEEGLFND